MTTTSPAIVPTTSPRSAALDERGVRWATDTGSPSPRGGEKIAAPGLPAVNTGGGPRLCPWVAGGTLFVAEKGGKGGVPTRSWTGGARRVPGRGRADDRPHHHRGPRGA